MVHHEAVRDYMVPRTRGAGAAAALLQATAVGAKAFAAFHSHVVIKIYHTLHNPFGVVFSITVAQVPIPFSLEVAQSWVHVFR